MNTIIKKLDIENYTPEELGDAGEILRSGGLIAFPTETVYGLGADGLNKDAARKVYAAKGRPSDNPLIIHIAKVEDLNILAKDIPEEAYQLAEVFWPGPLTMILKKQDCVPMSTTGGLDTVGIRLPANKIARDMIAQSGVFVAAPSANISGKPSPTIAEHVVQDMNGKIDMIIDGGKATLGLESTIIDLSSDQPMILRPGAITKEMLEHVIGTVEYDPVVLKKSPDLNIRPKAPGMKYRHYAPEGELTIYEGDIHKVVEVINEMAGSKAQAGYQVGIIATEETKDLYQHGLVQSIGSRKDDATIAAGLYYVLRELDQLHIDYIYSESFEENSLGQAIMNRLLKAAGYHIVKVSD